MKAHIPSLLLFVLVSAMPAEGQEAEKGKSIFVMEEKPVLRFGDVLRLEPTTKLDAIVWTSDIDREGGEFSVDRRRIGIEGRFMNVVAFEIERELGDDEMPWRDVFAEFRKWRAVRVKGGRFKMPFGEERLTSIADLDFVNRSLATEALTPGRDTGLEINGRVLGRGLAYKAGVFAHDGDVARGGTDEPGGTTASGTIATAPFVWADSPALSHVEIGVAATIGEVAEGLNGLRARTVGGYEAIAPHFVAGRRVRLGIHASWVHGRFAIRSELLEARDARTGQSLGGDDLPDVVGRGGYVGGTWTLGGDLKDGGSAPKRGLNAGGPGAIQIAARTEWLGFGSAAADGEPLRNPRAANILRNDLRSATFGVNWYPVRFVKLQFNLIREHISDPDRRPDPTQPVVFSRMFKIQFAL